VALLLDLSHIAWRKCVADLLADHPRSGNCLTPADG
jgi:hypothetical protein